MRYIDLFAGVGGFHAGLDKVGGYECVYTNEWDQHAASVYRRHFRECDSSDITTVDVSNIPTHDLICGGFPCQAFSVAGKKRGFEDTRGTLFYEIARIASHHRPGHLLLENVKGLLSHDSGQTIATMFRVLADLGYRIEWQVLNSVDFGVPQNRERIFIVGHLADRCSRQIFPIHGGGGKDSGQNQGREVHQPFKDTQKLSDAFRIRGTDGPSATLKGLGGGMGAKTGLYAIARGRSTEDYRPSDKAPTLRDGDKDNVRVVKRQPLRFLDRNQKNIEGDYAFTVDTSQTSGVKIDTKVRRLTPVECERLQGFPDDWTRYDNELQEISDTQRYKMMGNAVTTNVITAIGERLVNCGKMH